jgi:hypothetical protein
MKLPSVHAYLAVCLLGVAFIGPTRLPAQPSPGSPKSNLSVAPGTLVLSEKLPSNGTLVLSVNVGDLRIAPSTDGNRLRLEIHADNTSVDEEHSWVKQFEVAGDRAMVEIRTPKDHKNCVSCYSNLSVTVYIPRQTSIKLKLGVGDAAIHGIRGDKQIDVGIGDLKVGIRDPKEYAHVDISTRIGDIDDSIYHSASHGFLGKSVDIAQEGRYHLRAHVGIGDLKLVQEDAGK